MATDLLPPASTVPSLPSLGQRQQLWACPRHCPNSAIPSSPRAGSARGLTSSLPAFTNVVSSSSLAVITLTGVWGGRGSTEAEGS